MLKNGYSFISKHANWIVAAFFIAYFFLGFSIFKDYGVSTDEIFQNDKAIYNLDYITGKNTDLLTYPDRHYGAVLAIPLYLIGKSFADPRGDYLFRHLVTFLTFFASSVGFYFLARYLKINKAFALIGSAFYIFHPHIFSHSFYNIKDIPFLSVYLFSLFSLIHFTEKRSFKAAILHGFLSGMLVIFRLPGLLMWAITFLVWLMMSILNFRSYKRFILLGALYAISALLTLYIFMPALWAHPITEARAFFSMELFTWNGRELFMGQYLTPDAFPRYFLPVFMLITTPPIFTFFLIIGSLFLAKDLLIKRELFKDTGTPKLALVISFLFPILYIMIARPIIYNGWRHVFFVYAPFALIAAVGLQRVFSCVSAWNSIALRRVAQLAFSFLLLIQTISLTNFLIGSHPFQHVYYNRLAAPSLAQARELYSMDYWGLSYRAALETILRDDDNTTITVCGALNHDLRENLKIIEPQAAARIKVVKCDNDPDYYLTNYYYKLNDNGKGGQLWYQIEIFGAPIQGVYKLKGSTDK